MSNTEGAVAANVAGNEAANAGAPQQPQQGGWAVFKSVMSRMVFMFMMMQAMNYFKGKPPASTNLPASTDTKGGAGGGVALGGIPGNVFAKGASLDFYVYLSESELFNSFNDSNSLFYSHIGLEYGDWYFGENKDGVLIHNGQIPLSYAMQNNGSVYMHVYFTENGRSPDPSDKTHSKRKTFSTFKRLNKYIKKTYKKTKNLLTGETDKDEDYQLKAKDNLVEILSHWHPNITLNLVDDHTPWQSGSVPPPLNEHIEFDKSSGKYYPIVFINDYWNLLSDYYPINDTLSHLNLTMTFSHIQLWKWQLYLSQTMRNQLYGGMFADEANDEDQDTIKRTLLDTNPYLLAITVVITLVHSVFEFLAFKNDIQFWRNRKSLEGLSVNSVLFGCVTSLIVLLYVLDNDTNTVVRISVGVGLLIDLWKVPKVLQISLNHENKLLGILPRPVFVHKTSYVETNTNEYDRLAFKYLSWALFPLVIGYSVYSLLYLEHKGWYSWFLSMLYGFLLTFGFIMMTPQLFINYKLKSVAHLPWRMMTYKALNTFIDDIFAFVIKMPTMYRIGCFRDDIIFFIYLYQRWIYPVDKKRTNEYGTSGEMHEPGFVPPVDDTQQEQITAGGEDTSAHPKSE